MTISYSLHEIVAKLGGEVIGDEKATIKRVSSIATATQGAISFFINTKYLSQLKSTQASAVIMSREHIGLTDLPKIICDNPYAYFANTLALLNPLAEIVPKISSSAMIASTAKVSALSVIAENVVIGEFAEIGENVLIEAGCVIGDYVQIASNTKLQPNVVIYHHCQIGKNCVIASGTVIGADGFGYANQNSKWIKIPQVGRVIIHNDVEIGANSSIDRGALDDTIIEEGVKLDNLIQIGHNCKIGAHTVIAGCVGIAGSAVVGKHCMIGGAAMILGHLEITDNVTISPGSMITRSIKKSGTYTALMPFQEHSMWLDTAANIRKINQLSDKVKVLEKLLKKQEK